MPEDEHNLAEAVGPSLSPSSPSFLLYQVRQVPRFSVQLVFTMFSSVTDQRLFLDTNTAQTGTSKGRLFLYCMYVLLYPKVQACCCLWLITNHELFMSQRKTG